MGDFWGAFPQGRNVAQGQISDDFSVLRGNHNFKVGVNYRHEAVSDHGLQESTHGWYSFNSLADFANGVTNPDTGSLYIQSYTPLDVAHIRFANYGFYAQDEWNIKPNLKLTYGIRFEHANNPTCVDHCYNNLTAPFLSSNFDTSGTVAYNSIIKTGESAPYYGTDALVPQPRIGIVYSPKQWGTVIRAGVGLFADLTPGFLVSNVFVNAPYPYTSVIFDGTAVGPNAANAAFAQYSAFNNGFKNGATLAQLENVDSAFSPPSYFSTPQHFSTPNVVKWSFEVQQPFGAKNVMIATYAGNHSYNLLAINGFADAYNASGAPFAGLPTVQRDPMFTSVTQLTNLGISNYDGLTVQFKRAISYGFSGQIGYTWSHGLDDVSNGGSGLPYNGSNSLTSLVSPNVVNNYSNSDYDIRNSLVADMIWDVPWKSSSKGANYFVGGWTLSGKFYVRSGTPFSIIDSQLAGDIGAGSIGGTMLATLKSGTLPSSCGPSATATPCLGSATFAAAGTETGFGNIARNDVYGPGYTDMDLSLYKRFEMGEHAHLQVGLSAYNFLNHPNFAAPGHNVAVPGFGLITSTVTPPTSAYGAFQGSAVSGRIIVLTGKFVF
jgi:outer membrane receptor protein involved in Fe transport